MKADLYQRAFHRALELSGSRERLAEYLGTEPARLDAWLAGKARPSVEVLQTLARLLKHKMLMSKKRARR
jgi:transcriptional regulator with XRE-family HTH domain